MSNPINNALKTFAEQYELEFPKILEALSVKTANESARAPRENIIIKEKSNA